MSYKQLDIANKVSDALKSNFEFEVRESGDTLIYSMTQEQDVNPFAITPSDQSGESTVIRVSRSWSHIPMCSCAMAKKDRKDDKIFCEHVIGLTIQKPELSYVLYDMFV